MHYLLPVNASGDQMLAVIHMQYAYTLKCCVDSKSTYCHLCFPALYCIFFCFFTLYEYIGLVSAKLHLRVKKMYLTAY